MVNYVKFREWLVQSLGFGEKTAGDICSRLRRVLLMTGEQNPSKKTIVMMESIPLFTELSCSSKSQLRKAVRFYQDFENIDNVTK